MAQQSKGQALRWLFGPGALGLVLGAALLGPAPLYAQTPAPAAQVLTLDQDRLYAESLYGKALEARAIAANQALAAENRKIEQDLAAEEADLTQKRPTMAAAAFQPLADAFDAKVEQVRTDEGSARRGAQSLLSSHGSGSGRVDAANGGFCHSQPVGCGAGL